jgi:hypothetical protein
VSDGIWAHSLHFCISSLFFFIKGLRRQWYSVDQITVTIVLFIHNQLVFDYISVRCFLIIYFADQSKGLETVIAVSFGGLFGAFGESGQKRKVLIRGDGFQFSVIKFA